MVLSHLDPERQGFISRKVFEAALTTQAGKDDAAKVNEEFEKEMTRLLEQLRDGKINPMKVFEEADTDRLNGVTPAELEQAFRRVLPKIPQLQVKKWVAHINYNQDNVIDVTEYINALSVMYNKDQINGFSTEYLRNKARALEERQTEESVQKLIKELSYKIEESGLTKKQTFMNMDKSGDGAINRNELVLGLKSLGVHVALATNLLKVLDKDNTNSISLEEFCRVLG